MKVNPEDVLQWNIKQLWNETLLLIEEEPKIAKKEQIEKIKYGYNIRVPIQYIIQEWYSLYPSNKTVNIKGYGRHKLLEFLDEIEERETNMRNLIINNMDEEGIIKPRVR